MNTLAHAWQKSSYSGDSSNCVFVAARDRHTLMLRESDEPDTILATTRPALAALLTSVKAGRLGGLPSR
ncbi:DUF397 domain-containing protein [Streptomyces sp. N2-109]|uniref:DUF397 domain-containing protein n=1 Tax=Streptomyces gossypii TaxID=2883101 RepID=A0ABT2K1L2_9ACTN|nr:DUF397 domain-containing protein [Streptomyces gossypii]MCT2594057.1 DUF397 domain-containing protein [Streptomyces gossypii]